MNESRSELFEVFLMVGRYIRYDKKYSERSPMIMGPCVRSIRRLLRCPGAHVRLEIRCTSCVSRTLCPPFAFHCNWTAQGSSVRGVEDVTRLAFVRCMATTNTLSYLWEPSSVRAAGMLHTVLEPLFSLHGAFKPRLYTSRRVLTLLPSVRRRSLTGASRYVSCVRRQLRLVHRLARVWNVHFLRDISTGIDEPLSSS